MHAFGLQLDRAAARQRVETQPARGDELTGEQVDRAAVLAVREHDDAEFRGLLHDGEGDVVLGHDAQLDVGQPELHAADAECRDVAQIAGRVRARLPDHGVEREVDQRVGHFVRERAARRLDRALALERVHERQRAGRAAAECRARVVADAAEDVRVHVDGARQHQAARGVDHLGARAIDVPDRRDHAVLDQHVGRRPFPPARPTPPPAIAMRRVALTAPDRPPRPPRASARRPAGAACTRGSGCRAPARRAPTRRSRPDPSPARSRPRRPRRRGCA